MSFTPSRGVAQSGSALAWGARGRVFESLRPDHINQGVARFYLATLFYFDRFYPYKTTGSLWNPHFYWGDGREISVCQFHFFGW